MVGLLTGAQLVARLRAIRRAKGLSAQHLADLTQVISRSTLASIESGRRTPYTYDEARLVAQALEVDLRQVISDEPFSVTWEIEDGRGVSGG